VSTPESRIRTPRAPIVESATGRLAIFDLDRTLYPGSSLKPLAQALCDRGLVRRFDVARSVVGDAAFERCGIPVAVAPSRGLRRIARARSWTIVETGDR